MKDAVDAFDLSDDTKLQSQLHIYTVSVIIAKLH